MDSPGILVSAKAAGWWQINHSHADNYKGSNSGGPYCIWSSKYASLHLRLDSKREEFSTGPANRNGRPQHRRRRK